MPTEDDPTQPWRPPYTPTPQPVGLKGLIKLIWAIIKDYRKQPVKPGRPVCKRCGQFLEVMGFEGHEPVWGCPFCN